MVAAFNMTGFSRMGFAVSHSVTNFAVNSPTGGIGWTFQARSISPISALFFRYGARSVTPPTYRISLQSPNATGFADGTVLGGGSPASATFKPPASAAWDGSGQWITLANSYTPATRGELLVATIEHDPVANETCDATNNSSFGRGLSDLLTIANQIPYVSTKTSGTWSKITGNTNVCFAVEDADGVYGVPFQSTFNSTLAVAGQRHAAAITMPSGIGNTFTVGGLIFSSQRIGSAAATAVIGIWDQSGVPITSFTVDTDQQANPTNGGVFHYLFPTPAVLNYGTKYFFGVESTTSPISVTGINLTRQQDRAAYPNGLNRAYATWNGSSWTETNTRLPYVDLIFEDITPAAGSSSHNPFFNRVFGA